MNESKQENFQTELLEVINRVADALENIHFELDRMNRGRK